MKHPKQFYKSLNYDGYTWSGFINGFHVFSRKEDDGYYMIKCREKDIEDNNILDMVHFGVSL